MQTIVLFISSVCIEKGETIVIVIVEKEKKVGNGNSSEM